MSLEIRTTKLPIHKVCMLLSRLEGLDSLIMSLSRLSVSQCVDILGGLQFPHLEFFSAKTLPHEGLVVFLWTHPHLRSLILGRCETQSPCPLRAVRVLEQCSEMEGQSTCIASLVAYSPIARVTASFYEAAHTHTTLFASCFFSITNITFLDLDFSAPRDNTILASIAAIAPHITMLRLTERFPKGAVRCCDIFLLYYPNVVSQVEYPWTDSLLWASRLRSLSRLKGFSVCTYSSLVERPGNRLDEGKLITTWTSVATQLHGPLERITVLYSYDQAGSRMSAWARQGEVWRRKTTIADPDFSDLRG
jgi:hypothetical protein